MFLYLFINNVEVVLVRLVSVKHRFVLFVELKGEVCNWFSIKKPSAWTLFIFWVSQVGKFSKLGKIILVNRNYYKYNFSLPFDSVAKAKKIK